MALVVNGYLDGFDAVPFGFQHGKIKIDTGHGFIDGGESAGYLQYQAGQRIALAFYGIESIYWQAQGTAKVVQHDLGIGDIIRIVDFPEGNFFFVEFVADIADDLFEDVLHRNDAARAAEFIHHDGKMDALGLELLQQVLDQLGLGHEHDGPYEAVPVEIVFFQVGQQVLGVQDAHDLIESGLI